MPDIRNPEIAQAQRAITALKTLRPAYAALLDFHGDALIAQLASTADVSAPHPARNAQAQKTAHLQPLADRSDFPVDAASATKLLLSLCQVAQNSVEPLANSGRNVERAITGGQFDPAPLFEAVLGDDSHRIAALSEELSADIAHLRTLASLSCVPSITAFRDQLAAQLPADPAWHKSICPICGSPPMLSALADNGRRSLICAFCRHEWAIGRMVCPACEAADPHCHTYLHSETEPEYRVELCEACRGYIKTVDLRGLQRPFFAPLEYIATLHLDILAREKGYQSLVRSESETI